MKHITLSLLLLGCSIYGNAQNAPLNVNEAQRVFGGQTALDRMGTPKRSMQSTRIRAVYQDASGNFWFGTEGDGVCWYQGGKFTYYTRKDGLCSDFIHSISEDITGVWFTTRDGICRYDGTLITFLDNELRKTPYDPQLHNGKDALWFGARDGAYRYDGKSFSYLVLPQSDADVKFRQANPQSNKTPYAVYSILQDKKGNVWFGTEQRGVCRYDGKSFTWFTEKGLGKGAVRCIFQDRKGNIWFGNNGGGVYKYDGKKLINFTAEKGLGNPEFFKTMNGKEGTLARVWSIAEDRDGNLWFGTIDAGAWRYDGKTLTNFTMKNGLSSESVLTIYKDKTGGLWFGTDGGGVCRYDGKTFKRFTEAEARQ